MDRRRGSCSLRPRIHAGPVGRDAGRPAVHSSDLGSWNLPWSRQICHDCCPQSGWRPTMWGCCRGRTWREAWNRSQVRSPPRPNLAARILTGQPRGTCVRVPTRIAAGAAVIMALAACASGVVAQPPTAADSTSASASPSSAVSAGALSPAPRIAVSVSATAKAAPSSSASPRSGSRSTPPAPPAGGGSSQSPTPVATQPTPVATQPAAHFQCARHTITFTGSAAYSSGASWYLPNGTNGSQAFSGTWTYTTSMPPQNDVPGMPGITPECGTVMVSINNIGGGYLSTVSCLISVDGVQRDDKSAVQTATCSASLGKATLVK